MRQPSSSAKLKNPPISSTGDVDGDGKDDLLIGAYYASSSKGEAYLIFGTNWDALTDTNGNFSLTGMSKAKNTIRLIGRGSNNYAGWAVSSAGDVNGDKKADFLIGAPRANSSTGEAYLIFGRSAADWASFSDASGNFDLNNLTK
jgi:hypothetical protein